MRTEDLNQSTVDIDTLPVPAVLRLINQADHDVPRAVAAVQPSLASAVELAIGVLRAGGRVHYVGAGASGRIGMVDAAELVPTYRVPPDLFVAHLAGGTPAMLTAVEGVEDDAGAGSTAVAGAGTDDLVVGIAASGRTPYVAGALRAARQAGAATVLVSANPAAPLGPLADVHIGIDTGPEVIAGSTRMKAASAQKMVLNAFSTAVMVATGRTYRNLMVELVPLNAKLRRRQVLLLEQASGAGPAECAAALAEAGGDAKVALVMLLAGCVVEVADEALAKAGSIRAAVDALTG